MKKVLFVVYGLIAYIIFLGTFSYAVGFVTGLIVPKSLDDIPGSPLAPALVINAELLAFFALQHSVMARPVFKEWWTKFIPQPLERSTYVLVSSLSLLLLFWQWQPLGGIVWQAEPGVTSIVLRSLGLLGFVVVLVSTFRISHFDLFGLRQVWLHLRGKKYDTLPFRTPLFYKFVRHPLYLGFMIAFWATPTMTAAHLFFAIMTTGYLLLAIQLEEKDLVDHFGAKYMEYKRTVSMLLPFGKSVKGLKSLDRDSNVAVKS